MKGGRSKGPRSKGKGRGWFPFGPLKEECEGDKCAQTEGGRCAHAGKRNVRRKCWNCKRHGHLGKDRRALTDENREAYDDRTEYCSKDWTDWTGSRTDDWSDSSDYDWTQLDWYGDSNWYDFGWNDNWTWSTGSDSTGPSVLSQPQRPTVPSSTAPSSNSFTSAQSGRTGTLTRPLRTGTGLLSTHVSVIAVLNSFARPQGLPLTPETVSSPDVTTSDEYDDVLGRHHEDCFSSLSPKEHWILFDSGAAAHCCPLDYAPDYPLLPVGRNPPNLKSVTGMPLNVIGRKLIRYDTPGAVLFINYYVCDVPFCIVSVARMLLQDFCTVVTKDSMKLLTPQRTSRDITRHGTLLYLAPDIAPYHPDMKIVEGKNWTNT